MRERLTTASLLLGIVALVGVALPGAAGAVTFGANLSAHTSNSNVTCGSFNIMQYAGRVGCSVYTTGNTANLSDTSATHVIPFPDPRVNGNQSGTITQVTLKPAQGAPAGQARLSVVEYIRDANSTADPGLAQDIADSANFTMTPGSDGLVHVATDLPARSLYNSSDNSYRYDVLVLSMLDNTTPIPADLNSTFLSAWISPYVDIPSTNGELTAPLPSNRQGTGCCGFGPNPFYASGSWYSYGEVLMQADLTINAANKGNDAGAGGNAGGNTGGNTGNNNGGGTVVPLSFGKASGRLVGNSKVILPISCVLDTVCQGTLQLLSQAQGKGTTAKKQSKATLYGKGTIKIPAKKTGNVTIKLTKAGKRYMRKHKTARLTAKATVGSQVTTQIVTIKRAKSIKKK